MWPIIKTRRSSRRSSRRIRRAEGGFTLLELMVAMVIFSLASLMAYSGLHSVTSTKSALEREIRFWRELGQVFDRLDGDLVQLAPRAENHAEGAPSAPLLGGRLEDGGFFLEMTRFDENRSPLRARYRCAQGELKLVLQPFNAAPPPVENGVRAIPVHTLLSHIEDCELSFLGGDNVWFSAWPGDQQVIKPRAIRVRFNLVGQGRFERLFYLP